MKKLICFLLSATVSSFALAHTLQQAHAKTHAVTTARHVSTSQAEKHAAKTSVAQKAAQTKVPVATQQKSQKRLPKKAVANKQISTSSQKTHMTDLLDVYHAALQHDMQYQADRATWLGTRETLNQSIAALLPLIVGTATDTGTKARTRSWNNASINYPYVEYNTKAIGLTVTQPIINFASWANVSEASNTVKAAKATFASAKQALILRVAQAYLAVLLNRDTLRFTTAEKRSTYRQLEQVRQRYQVGLDAVTSVYDAQAAYDKAVAEEISAKNALENQREQLRQITGTYYPHIAGLKHSVPLSNPTPHNVTDWVHAAHQNNLDLIAARFSAMAAHAAVVGAAAGHLPTVNFVGTASRTFTGDQKVYTTGGGAQARLLSASVQLSLPIFSGGAVISQTKEADYGYEKAEADLQASYRQAEMTTRQTYNSVLSGMSKIRADRQNIRSNSSSLKSTEAAYKVGTRTIVDVLLAQQNLYQAQTTAAQDQYDYINNLLTLKAAVGSLRESDLAKINAWL